MERNTNKREVTFNNVHNKKYHTPDGIKWDSRACAVVAHVWFIHNGVPYILLGKRGPKGDQPGLWNIPCGYMDWNENLKEAMFREIWEETGLDLGIFHGYQKFSSYNQPWFVNTDPSENRQNIVLHTAVIIDSTFDLLPELSLENMEEEESDGAYWMAMDAVLSMDAEDFAFNHKERIIQFIEKFGNKLKKSN